MYRLLVRQFFSLFAQFKTTTTKSHENYVFLYPFSNMAISPKIMNKLYFIPVNCTGWQVWCGKIKVQYDCNVFIMKSKYIHKTDNIINLWCKKGVYTCTDLSSYVCCSYLWRRIFFNLLFLVFHCPVREIPVASPEQRHSSCKSSATHSCQCVQYFPVSKQRHGCRCLVFLRVYRCWCMRLRAEAARTP